jgi:hypothetical protein
MIDLHEISDIYDELEKEFIKQNKRKPNLNESNKLFVIAYNKYHFNISGECEKIFSLLDKANYNKGDTVEVKWIKTKS